MGVRYINFIIILNILSSFAYEVKIFIRILLYKKQKYFLSCRIIYLCIATTVQII